MNIPFVINTFWVTSKNSFLRIKCIERKVYNTKKSHNWIKIYSYSTAKLILERKKCILILLHGIRLFIHNAVFIIRRRTSCSSFLFDMLIIILLHCVYELRGTTKFARPRLSHINDINCMIQQLIFKKVHV